MSGRYFFYTPDGRLEFRTSVPAGTTPEDHAYGNLGWVEIPDGTEATRHSHYVSLSGAPTLTAKATLLASWDKTTLAADGADVATLSGLPNCTVHVDNDGGTAVTDGSFELTAAQPGEYRVVIDEPEYLLTEWIINAS